jgi:hypothetical protein
VALLYMYGGSRRAEQTRRLTCQAPAACTGRRRRSWRWRRSGSPATEPSGPVTKLDPLDHLQPIPAAHWTHGGLGGVKFRPLAFLFAQLLAPRMGCIFLPLTWLG